jgi:ParB/RepB/Spo0J family partition protein
MNAVSPQAAPVLTDAAVKNVALLRYLSTVPTVDRPLSKAEWARIVGKDAANLNRAMKLLTEDGVVEGWDEWPAARLTTLGLRVLSGLDVIDGRAVLPAGYALVRHDRIAPHPLNPRKDFTSPKAAEDLDALRVSILEHGVRYPLEVRPAGADGVHYLISGERRWRAVGIAIQDGDLPEDHELLVQVKPVDDEAHLVLALEENIQRARLSYSEEASAYAYFIEALGWDPADVADKFGRSKKHVQDYLRLRTLPADVLARLDAREITYREARAMFQEHREPAAAEPEPDMFEGAPGIGLLAPDLQPKLPELSAKEALVLAELVDKADRVPAEGLEPGWTAVAETPADKVSEALIRRQMLAFRSRGPESYARAMIHSSGVKAWLEVNGFYEGVVARHGLLRQLRAEVVGEQAADDFGDRFVTAWLNPVPDAEEADAAAGAQGAARPGGRRLLRIDAQGAGRRGPRRRRCPEGGRRAVGTTRAGQTSHREPRSGRRRGRVTGHEGRERPARRLAHPRIEAALDATHRGRTRGGAVGGPRNRRVARRALPSHCAAQPTGHQRRVPGPGPGRGGLRR